MILKTHLNLFTENNVLSKIDDLIQINNPLRKQNFLGSLSYTLEFYNEHYNFNKNYVVNSFEPIALVHHYIENGLLDEAYWLFFLIEVIGFHPKSKWKLLSTIYFNHSQTPYLTWKNVNENVNIGKYLIEKSDNCKGLFLGRYYKYPIFNQHSASEISQLLSTFILNVNANHSFSNYILQLPTKYIREITSKHHFFYYRYYHRLQYIGLANNEELRFHLNSQLMIKKSLRHLFEDKKKLNIDTLHQVFNQLLEYLDMPLKEVIICDALIEYYNQFLFEPFQKKF